MQRVHKLSSHSGPRPESVHRAKTHLDTLKEPLQIILDRLKSQVANESRIRRSRGQRQLFPPSPAFLSVPTPETTTTSSSVGVPGRGTVRDGIEVAGVASFEGVGVFDAGCGGGRWDKIRREERQRQVRLVVNGGGLSGLETCVR
jgi:hypothetical protein